jgi:hypothetical protein
MDQSVDRLFNVQIGPVMGRWNAFLEARFPLKLFRHSEKISISALGKRVACDQLVMYASLSSTLSYRLSSSFSGPLLE